MTSLSILNESKARLLLHLEEQLGRVTNITFKERVFLRLQILQLLFSFPLL